MANMNVATDISTHKWSDLEEYVMNSNPSSFPTMLQSEITNTKPYPEKYKDLKTHLGQEQDSVEYKNTLHSIYRTLKGKPGKLKRIYIQNIYDKIIVLNKHGKGHIESVIKHASNIAKCIENKDYDLSSFEAFILLCSIQIHDIGNKYGRENHQTSFRNDFENYAKTSFITSAPLQRCIFNIASAHGGEIEGDSDTIEKLQLQIQKPIIDMSVRQRFLAAILRFSDELADDWTRETLNINYIPEYSKIFHVYSSTLHTVRIEKNELNNAHFIRLCYELNQNDAIKKFNKINKDGTIKKITLLEEIFDRTIKMERERRYCSRYLQPYIQLTEIIVEIDVILESFKPYTIRYTLMERGYPGEIISIPGRDKFIDDIDKNASPRKEKVLWEKILTRVKIRSV